MGLINDKEEISFEDFGFTIADHSDDKDERFVTLDIEEDFYQAGKQEIVKTLNKSQDEINIALSGGSLKNLYSRVSSESPNEFTDTVFWQVDERLVDPDDDKSNYKLIEENLLGNLEGYKDFKYFDTELEGIDKILDRYEASLVPLVKGESNAFDLIVLGVGPDGHIGSIFPETEVVSEEKKLVAHNQTDVFDIKDRFTLTFPAILNADRIMIYMSGKEKRKIFDEIRFSEKSFNELPAKRLLEHPNVVFYLGNF